MNVLPFYYQTSTQYLNWEHGTTQFERAIAESRRAASHAEFMELARQCKDQMEAISKILERCLYSADNDTHGG